MPLGQRFDAQKAIEAILYIAERVQEPSFHRIAKILYFADKQKLANFGGLVLGDEYWALKHGPVPSAVYDILKSVRGDGHHSARDQAKAAFSVRDSHNVAANRKANLRYLSRADLQCLDNAIGTYGQMGFARLTKESHDTAWDAVGENDVMSFEDIARATHNPEAALVAVRDRFDFQPYVSGAAPNAATKAS